MLDPDLVIAPRALTLAGHSTGERRRWGARVAEDLARRHPEPHDGFLHAGVLYRHPIERRLLGPVAAPLEGLGIGE